jgi:hypothetical protein
MAQSIRTEIIINASAVKVWEILIDFAAYPVWNPFIIAIEGSRNPGDTLKCTLKNGSRTFVFRPRLIDYHSEHRFEWLGHLWIKGLFDGRHFFEIETLAPNQVRLSHGEHFSGLLATALLRKMGNDTRNGFIAMNQALKQRAEQL